MHRQGQSEASDGESCWPFTEGQPASAFQDVPATLPEADVLPVWTPPPQPSVAIKAVHPVLAAVLRRVRPPSLVVFAAGIVVTTVVTALILVGLGLA